MGEALTLPTSPALSQQPLITPRSWPAKRATFVCNAFPAREAVDTLLERQTLHTAF